MGQAGWEITHIVRIGIKERRHMSADTSSRMCLQVRQLSLKQNGEGGREERRGVVEGGRTKTITQKIWWSLSLDVSSYHSSVKYLFPVFPLSFPCHLLNKCKV